MSKETVKKHLKNKLTQDGLIDTGIAGVQIFRYTRALQCTPVVYEPAAVVIVSGSKEAILNGQSYVYDSNAYLCCTMAMPVEAGVRNATPDAPLLGLRIPLDSKVFREILLEMRLVKYLNHAKQHPPRLKGICLADWDDRFTEAILRFVQLDFHTVEASILGEARLREIYYAILQGSAGQAIDHFLGAEDEIAQAIRYLSTQFEKSVSIDELTKHLGMSRAVFHRKFKQVTTLSPIQFQKQMRLNRAAMLIGQGQNVLETAHAVGYASGSQFSREFKRMFGVSPKKWRTVVP